MSTILSNRVQKVKPSATMAVSDKAKELKSKGLTLEEWHALKGGPRWTR